jgi:hypothetical protein
MPRESFVLTQDIGSGQLVDAHVKPGSNLQKLVDKKVIDTLMLSGLSLSGLTTRLDIQLLDQPISVGPTDIGILTSKQHPLFVGNTDTGIPDSFSQVVRGNLSSVAPIFDPVLMTLGMNTGVATTPANFAIGDIVRIQGQGLTGEFFAQISNIVGPTLTFVDPGTVNPRIFVEAATGTYSMERVRRWTMSWVDSVGGGFSLSAATYSIGALKRVYLADIGAQLGWIIMPAEAESPRVPGGAVSIASGQVSSGFIGNAAVVSGSIASGAIGHFHIANDAVQSGNVGSGQIASGHLASGLLANITGGGGLTSGSVTSGFLGNSSVLSGSIGSGQIASGHIASGFVAQLISPNDVFRYSLLNRL